MFPETKREYFGRKLLELFEYFNIEIIDGLLLLAFILLSVTLIETIKNLKSGKDEKVNKKIGFVDLEVIAFALLILLAYFYVKF